MSIGWGLGFGPLRLRPRLWSLCQRPAKLAQKSTFRVLVCSAAAAASPPSNCHVTLAGGSVTSGTSIKVKAASSRAITAPQIATSGALTNARWAGFPLPMRLCYRTAFCRAIAGFVQLSFLSTSVRLCLSLCAYMCVFYVPDPDLRSPPPPVRGRIEPACVAERFAIRPVAVCAHLRLRSL